MRTFTFVLLATCFITATVFANCPKADDVQKALMHVTAPFKDQMAAALKRADIKAEDIGPIVDFETNLSLRQTNSPYMAKLLCTYSEGKKPVLTISVDKE